MGTKIKEAVLRYAVIAIAIVCCLLGGESSDDWGQEWEEWQKKLFVTQKNIGLAFCISEFYKDQKLPKAIEEGWRAFSSSEYMNRERIDEIFAFVKANINDYIPQFKPDGLYAEHQPWYFVACLNMYNSKEYEDMIQRKGKYAK